jgi:paraquat-inducible protein B
LTSGLEGLTDQVSELLDKVNALPLEELAESANESLVTLDELLSSESLQGLPASLQDTLASLRDALDGLSGDSSLQEELIVVLAEFNLTLDSFRELMTTLNDQPNSIVFPRAPAPDPIPPSGQ